MTKRRILYLSGADLRDFLQGLITNDVSLVDQGLVYAAMLTPQGKFIADFFLAAAPEGIYLDVAEGLADGLVQRLSMYKLRADVTIGDSGLYLHRGLGEPPADGLADPRHTALGWRAYRETPQTDDTVDWTAIRVAHMIPQTGIELTPDTFILEVGFERLSGVDFRKGCYVGQEVTARMKHKTELRKGLAKVSIIGQAETGSAITSDGKPAGTLLSRSEGQALAYLRFDRAQGEMQAGEALVTRDTA
ncbi:tRNA-modifying protein YgfZ [Roseobacter fucihabitans]|uniref:tRNA-modifying protein YgfZ n=1 Tax=Roseobacter fucihabitans TaxID=1537242 RepID=A0ABZ2BVF6_9RHOB|nr:folate-binding protein YgfZ [Roseobacter litoralis]MBC6967638.1 putative global regulator [Roseobacter litoralis]